MAGDEKLDPFHPLSDAEMVRHPRFLQERIFEKVSDRDLITLAERLCGSLEYYSMVAVSKVMYEVSWRDLWPAVIERRAYMLRLRDPESSVDVAQIAAHQIELFRNENFPVPPEMGGTPNADEEVARAWNGYMAF